MIDERLEMMILSREEYRRFWQILEELETLMWMVKDQNRELEIDEE